MSLEKLKVLSAFDQEEIAELDQIDEAQAKAMMTKAHALYLDRDAWLPKTKRLEILEKTIQLVKERMEPLIRDAAAEGGKPYVDSKVEVVRGIDGIQIAIRELHELKGETIPMGSTASSSSRLAFTVREPRGVVLAISAFNHPFNLIVHQVIPAIVAGCPVIVKPAATTPISCKNLVEILYEAGLPRDWCQMVNCSNEVAESLVTDPRTSFLTFIGSAKVGWYLRSKLPPGADCALEHGGVAPVIIDETADWKSSIAPLVKGGFYHAGQVCVSVQRIYVHESIAEAFTKEYVSAAKKLKVGDPLDSTTEVGPLILPREVDRIDEWVKEATQEGELLCGGKRISETTYEPTVVLNPKDDVRLSTSEVFGPVVCIYTYKEMDEALRRANALDVFFQAAIFTQNMDRALRAAHRMHGMAVMINDHTAFRVDWMPFGGHMQSGLGVGGIGYTVEDMTISKLIVMKSEEIL